MFSDPVDALGEASAQPVRFHMRGAENVDVPALERALRQVVEGEVRFDAGSRALYATDASNYRQVPIGVVVPKTTEDVVNTVAVCAEHGAPVLSRGGGTSLCGQCCNVAVVMDFSKYLNRILEIDPERRIARVQPGVVLDELREAAKQHGLTFAPDPATHNHNTLGGMIGNNSCGPHSVMGGETVHNVIALDVLTYDGVRIEVGETNEARYAEVLAAGGRPAEIYRGLRELRDNYADDIREKFPPIPRRVSGYNLNSLLPEHGFNLAQSLVGSEGTCVVLLEATLRLLPEPPVHSLLVLGYPDVYEAADHILEVLDSGPIALEGMDDRLIADMRKVGLHTDDAALLPEGGGWLLVEYGGQDKREADDKARALMDKLKGRDDAPSMKLFDDPKQEAHIWKVRESGLGATAHVPDQKITWEGWEDSSVPPAKLGEYLRKLRALFEKYGYGCDLYGHFGQGCVHTRIDFDLETAEGIASFRRFLHEATHLVVSLGGSISGEHGDGQSKAELLPIMFGERLMQAFRRFKELWDPQGKMNPGKVIDAYAVSDNLRLGTLYNPKEVKTAFRYTGDNGNFSRTVLRCVGVGECRKKSGTMCPSYMATGEEMHSTRGRAHLLFEMLDGGVLKQGWREPAVKEALDLCLSCKGCKGECPVSVDMATYKAEFLSHYYEGRSRPLAAYLFGHIDRFARAGSHAARLVNALVACKPLAALGKRLVGIAPQRSLPQLSARSFSSWFGDRAKPAAKARMDVVLWPDTFNNYFHSEVAQAAVEALEYAGCRVHVPKAAVCCGRPLYEFGMLEQARAYLKNVIDVLGEEIRDGIPVIGLEPACVSVFREELPQLLPDDEQGKRLTQQVFLLSEFLGEKCGDVAWPKLNQQALVHAHCHHKSVLGFDAERALLERLGIDVKMPDTGCCGMAGSFGFEREKYDVSMRCGERVLLPAVRESAAETLLIADGYSCAEQIAQGTGRRPLHLAQVLQRAIRQGDVPPSPTSN